MRHPVTKGRMRMPILFLRTIALVAALSAAACGDFDASETAAADRAQLERVVLPSTPRLVVEVDTVEGVPFSDEISGELRTVLVGLIDKPAGVEIVYDEILSSGSTQTVWSWAELEALSARHRSVESSDDSARVHVLIVNGRSDRDDGPEIVLGLSGHHRLVVLFAESIDRVCTETTGDLGQGLVGRLCTQTQLSIWSHEMGHVLGLVDSGVPMVEPHEDPDHPGHDVDPECIMHAYYNSATAVAEIRGRLQRDEDPGIRFCDQCRADLEMFDAE